MNWNYLNLHAKKHESSLSKEFRRKNGIYYTDMDLAYHLISEAVMRYQLSGDKSANEIKFLEPCVGTGSYVFSYVKKIMEVYEDANIDEVVDNIYVADNDIITLQKFKDNFYSFLQENYRYELSSRWFKEHCFQGLAYDLTGNSGYICISQYLLNKQNKFDIIATNPPYKNLRAERRHYLKESDYERDRESFKLISRASKVSHPYASSGSQNLYKIFVEEILERYLEDKGIASLLVPRTILSDNGTYELRSLILESYNLNKVTLIPESSRWITASQAICCLLVEKRIPSPDITIEEIDDNLNVSNRSLSNKELIKSTNVNKSITLLSDYEYKVLSMLSKYPRLGDKGYINNLRGELDISLNKKCVNNIEGLPLVRGRNIKPLLLERFSDDSLVYSEFLCQTSKSKYVKNLRIACQQISNMSRSKRLYFCKIPSGYILGNSVNFIAVESNDEGINLGYLFALLNSELYNWIFKIFSSNNHISNRELSSLPLINEPSFIKRISNLGDDLLENPSGRILEEVNKVVEDFVIDKLNLGREIADNSSRILQDLRRDLSHMGLLMPAELKKTSPKNSRYFEILRSSLLTGESLSADCMALDGLITKYEEIFKGGPLNWVHYKLSDLDLEMIETVPPGGNWKYIRDEVFVKSKRLQGIRKSGGRTTLYGRLSYEAPSYTITTYFNRPGNGTYVHPSENRVITAREAARIQSFPDNFYFCGNKSQLLKQIGNAVPPIFSYYIAKSVMQHIPISKSIDLFCGAGGMSVGFSKAGVTPILASDFEKSACASFKVNHPSTEVVCGDITSLSVQEQILNIAGQHKIDIICGGPPCQGFSNAGKRFLDDPRNMLFKEFLFISEKVRPKVIVMENVEGILSFNKGATLKEIEESFVDIGYSVKAQKFNTYEYGVPQRRKRVIFIAIRNDINFTADQILYTLVEFQANLITTNVSDAIGDFDPNLKIASNHQNSFYRDWVEAHE